MLEIKDPAIKLFGQTIPLPDGGENPTESGGGSPGEGLRSTGDESSDQDLNSEMEEEEEKKESGEGKEEIEEQKVSC